MSETYRLLSHGSDSLLSSFSFRMYGLLNSKAFTSCTVSAATRAATARRLHNESCVLLRHDDKESGVTTLTLNRPEKYNVLSWKMLDALQIELDDIAEDEVCITYQHLLGAIY